MSTCSLQTVRLSRLKTISSGFRGGVHMAHDSNVQCLFNSNWSTVHEAVLQSVRSLLCREENVFLGVIKKCGCVDLWMYECVDWCGATSTLISFFQS